LAPYATLIDCVGTPIDDISLDISPWSTRASLISNFGVKAAKMCDGYLGRSVYDVRAQRASVNYPYVTSRFTDIAPFAWAMWLHVGTAATVQTILEIRAAEYQGFMAFTGSYRANFNFDLNSTEYRQQYGPNLHDGNWHHIAFVYDRTTVLYYCDGALAATISAPEPGNLDYGAPARFGGHVDTSSFTLQGLMCDMLFWRTSSISPDAIAALADPGNVDLRVANGPPLILPVRVYYPAVTVVPSAAKVPWHLFSTAS